jgi:hypothetical protein
MQWGEQGANGHPRRRRDFPNIFNPNGNRIFFPFQEFIIQRPCFRSDSFLFYFGR